MSGASESDLRARILEELSQIQDPDLNKDIVSLGFVKNLELKSSLLGGTEVRFEIELTTPACPIKEEFKKSALERVAAIKGVNKVDIKMSARVVPQKTEKHVTGVSNIIAVGSGKGGVGKSTVAVNLALALKATGARVGLLDADIYGPSLALMLGITEQPQVRENRILPVEAFGLPVMTFAFFAPVGEAVIWRGPMIGKAVEQMLFEVNWGELDYLVVDLPPGTGDVHLSLAHVVDLAGAVLVSTPQEVALLDTIRGLSMFEKLKIPVLGLIENMSGSVFGSGGAEKKAHDRGLPFLGRVPLEAELAQGGDTGRPLLIAHPEHAASKVFQEIAKNVAHQLSVHNLRRTHAPLGS